MKRIVRSHIFIGLLSVILALVISFVLTPMYSRAVEKKGDVVRFKRDVGLGSRIEDKDLEVVNIGIYNISDKIIRTKEELTGRYAKTDLYSGMYAVREAISETPIQKDLYLNNIPEDKYAISVTVQNYAAGLSSKLLQGDVVSLIVKRQDEDGSLVCEIPDTLMYMEVLGATEEGGSDKTAVSDERDDKKKNNERLATVTLLANKYQVSELSSYEGESVIHIALKNRKNERMKMKLLAVQDEYFKELEASEYKEIEKLMEEEAGDPEEKKARKESANEDKKGGGR